MNCRRYRQVWGLALTGVALLASVSCSKTVREGRASSYLVIERLQGAPGVDPKSMGATLASDVVTNGTIWEDPGKVTLSLALKDPGSIASPSEPSTMNFITLDRYHVSFSRADGRNTQGVDVPYAFDGAATGTVGKSALSIGFVLVRAQAKMEAPLLALRGFGGGSVLISTIAEVTFYGHDQAGNQAAVTGHISVNFADWGDPEK